MRKLYAFLIAAILALAIASPGVVLAQAGSSSSSTASTSSPKTRTSTAAQKLDINRASKEQLDALPGIGEAYAQKRSSPIGPMARSATW